MRMIDVKLERVEVVLPANNSKTFSFFSLLFKITLILSAVLLFAGLKGFTAGKSDEKEEVYGDEFSQKIGTLIKDGQQDTLIHNMLTHLIFQLYSDRHFKACWTSNFQTNHQYSELIDLIGSAEKYGLFSHDYDLRLLDSLESNMKKSDDIQIKNQHRANLEQTATRSAFKLLINLSIGLNPGDSLLAVSDLADKLDIYLNYICSSDHVRDGILAVQPQSDRYKLLQKALQNYLLTVKIDTAHYSLSQLKQSDSLVKLSLVHAGYLQGDSIRNPKLTEDAIRKLQKAYNIKETCKADDKTLRMLCKSTREVFNIVALNLDRCRKDNLTNGTFILVNIPEFRLYYYDFSGNATIYNVIVGKPLTPTPILASRLDRIIINPTWNVPRSILINEIIPKMESDTQYMSKHDFVLIDDNNNPLDASKINWNKVDEHQFNYYVRQQTCDNNALGVVKFLFPNQYSVYLHDTQARILFRNETRALSHGCVRVQYPEKLAQQIFRNQNNETCHSLNFRNLLKCKKTNELKLPEQVPIYITYYTCTTDSAGDINFHPDIYAIDDQAVQNLQVRNF
jgi:L,D-transpeptidase YcbB